MLPNSGDNFCLLLTMEDSLVTPKDERLYKTLSELQKSSYSVEKKL